MTRKAKGRAKEHARQQREKHRAPNPTRARRPGCHIARLSEDLLQHILELVLDMPGDHYAPVDAVSRADERHAERFTVLAKVCKQWERVVEYIHGETYVSEGQAGAEGLIARLKRNPEMARHVEKLHVCWDTGLVFASEPDRNLTRLEIGDIAQKPGMLQRLAWRAGFELPQRGARGIGDIIGSCQALSHVRELSLRFSEEYWTPIGRAISDLQMRRLSLMSCLPHLTTLTLGARISNTRLADLLLLCRSLETLHLLYRSFDVSKPMTEVQRVPVGHALERYPPTKLRHMTFDTSWDEVQDAMLFWLLQDMAPGQLDFESSLAYPRRLSKIEGLLHGSQRAAEISKTWRTFCLCLQLEAVESEYDWFEHTVAETLICDGYAFPLGLHEADSLEMVDITALLLFMDHWPNLKTVDLGHCLSQEMGPQVMEAITRVISRLPRSVTHVRLAEIPGCGPDYHEILVESCKEVRNIELEWYEVDEEDDDLDEYDDDSLDDMYSDDDDDY